MNGRLTTGSQIDSGTRVILDEQHRDAGDAAVDEVARQEESVEAHARRENAE